MTPSRIVVAHVIDSMDVGGAQRQLLNLFRAVDRARFDLRLVCLRRKGAFGEALENEGFPVAVVGKRLRADWGTFWRLVGVLRAWRPDVVHCSIFTANLWGRLAALVAGVPVRIAHEQSTVSFERWHRRALDRLLARVTYRVLTVSEDLRRRVVAEERIAPARVEVLPNAIDTSLFAPDAARTTADLSGSPGLRVGAVGRLEPRKDQTTLVRAARRVADSGSKAHFFLAGEGPERPHIEAEVARLGLGDTFHLLGERSDVPALLRSFDVYVLCSLTEGLSLAILEAMAAGVPVVATRVGGNPELLDEGRAGLLVEPGDDAGLARAIGQLLRDPAAARDLGQRGAERARGLFDIGVVARRLEALYETAVATRGRRSA